MLVLVLKKGESITIQPPNSPPITVSINRIPSKSSARLNFNAPKEIKIIRSDAIKKEPKE